MNKKLTYQKFMNLDNIVTIDLFNDYSIIAISSKDTEKNVYNVSLRLKENTVDDWKIIENAENIEFDGSVRNINAAILKHVATLLHDGFFDYYIARYEYELNCFDIGNEKMEKERLDKNNV